MNNVTVIGRLGKTPELKTTTSGKKVCSFPLALKGRNKTVWVDIVAWESTAELCERFLVKGSLVGIEGRIDTREYTDKNGVNRKTFEIVVEDLTLIQYQKKYQQEEPETEIDVTDEMEDLPF